MVICSYYRCCCIYYDLSILRIVVKKIIILSVLLVVFVLPTEAQCAMCRAVLENEEGQGAAKGINNGIVYLMSIPYILVFGLGYFIYRKYFKAK
mgnify:CR=1 FL=1